MESHSSRSSAEIQPEKWKTDKKKNKKTDKKTDKKKTTLRYRELRPFRQKKSRGNEREKSGKVSLDRIVFPDLRLKSERTPKQVLDARLEEVRRVNHLTVLVKRLGITALTVYLLLGVVFGTGIVHGRSMYPNLKTGDVVFFIRVDKAYQKGNIVIVNMPDGEELVKRVVAVQGDIIDVDAETGKLLVNGEVEEEEYTFGATYEIQGRTKFPVKVPKGSVFVLGDNRMVSSDSREFGLILTEQIEGKLLFLFRLYEIEK